MGPTVHELLKTGELFDRIVQVCPRVVSIDKILAMDTLHIKVATSVLQREAIFSLYLLEVRFLLTTWEQREFYEFAVGLRVSIDKTSAELDAAIRQGRVTRQYPIRDTIMAIPSFRVRDGTAIKPFSAANKLGGTDA